MSGWGLRPPPGRRRSQFAWLHWKLTLLVLASTTFIVANSITSNEVTSAIAQSKLKSNEPLSDFEVSQKSIFVGGTNVLYQVDVQDLEVEALVKTGPLLDSPRCHASGCSGGVHANNISKSLTNNVNKVLVVDEENTKLIVCGSVRQGSCSMYDLRNISSSPADFKPEAVAANDDHSSTFAFIGPQRYNRWGQGNVLYVGTTYTSHGDYRHDVPAISSRNLLDLSFAEYSVSKQVRHKIKFDLTTD